MSSINLMIDDKYENKPEIDTLLHFLNECILFNEPKTFVKNFIKYRLLKKH